MLKNFFGIHHYLEGKLISMIVFVFGVGLSNASAEYYAKILKRLTSKDW